MKSSNDWSDGPTEKLVNMKTKNQYFSITVSYFHRLPQTWKLCKKFNYLFDLAKY